MMDLPRDLPPIYVFCLGEKDGKLCCPAKNPAFPGASSPAEADTATSADKALWNTVRVWADGIRLGEKTWISLCFLLTLGNIQNKYSRCFFP
jgi:hypothetical protein